MIIVTGGWFSLWDSEEHLKRLICENSLEITKFMLRRYESDGEVNLLNIYGAADYFDNRIEFTVDLPPFRLSWLPNAQNMLDVSIDTSLHHHGTNLFFQAIGRRFQGMQN